jgi:hypothetical protein
MATTIQISKELQHILKSRKLRASESYEEVIWDLIEDTMELSEETKKDIEKSLKEYKEGKFSILAEVKEELGL